MQNKLFKIIVLILLFANISVISLAQKDSPGDLKKNNKVNGTKKTETLKKTDTVKNPSPKKVEKKITRKVDSSEVVKKRSVSGKDLEGLLILKEGSYKHERIPEIKIKKVKVEIDNTVKESLVIPDKIDVEDNKKAEEKGLFGFSKGKTDIIAWIALVLFILLIFVLYRIRAKSSSRNVLRSFPKK